MLYGIIGVCVAIIIVLLFLLNRKIYIDKSNLEKNQNMVRELEKQEHNLNNRITDANQKYQHIINEYNAAVATQQDKLDELFLKRQTELDNTFAAKRKEQELILENKKKDVQEELFKVTNAYNEIVQEYNEKSQLIEIEFNLKRQQFDAILAPLQQYEKDKQDKLYYTIQVPEEYREDIDFLLTNVSQKVQHPDIISKLVWTEYIKPNIDETFKRIAIEAKPGIYKITNINTGKAYIGKSTDVKKRLTDHFKSSVGIKSIADQAVHHAILKEGIWNWSLEIITYCEKEQLNELEKYYIDFFKTQTFGYNKNAGGGG